MKNKIYWIRNRFLYLGQVLLARNPWYLAPLSWLYALTIFIRNKFYDNQWLPIHKIPITTVSIGNIQVGGTGKTPFTLLLAQSFSHRKIAILTRGYGQIPDEALLLQRRLPEAKIYIGKDRIKLAKQAAKEGAELLILDDGLQYRKLHRDFEIILGPLNGRYLPWGFLRDSPRRKGDAYFSYEQDLTLNVKRIIGPDNRPVSSISGWNLSIFCAIATPERFKNTVERLGATVTHTTYFADHEIPQLSKLPQAKIYLCTEKDFVKLPPNNLPIYYLEMEMSLVNPLSLQSLIEKIDRKIDNYPNG